MVQVNDKNKEITIKVSGDTSDLVQMQRALIDLLQFYNYKELGNGAGETIYHALSLLENLLPDYDQQKRGFTNEADYLELPDNLTPEQSQHIKEALFAIQTGTTVRPEKNKVLEALQNMNR